jgi:enoyl-CoA hydratase/carnithine racemase
MTGAPGELVLAEHRGPVLVLTFNRPPRRVRDLLAVARLVGHSRAADLLLSSRISPASMAIIKSQLSNDADGTYADSVTREEGLMFQAFLGSDVVEGVASHLDKRPPDFPSLPVRSSDVPL